MTNLAKLKELEAAMGKTIIKTPGGAVMTFRNALIYGLNAASCRDVLTTGAEEFADAAIRNSARELIERLEAAEANLEATELSRADIAIDRDIAVAKLETAEQCAAELEAEVAAIWPLRAPWDGINEHDPEDGRISDADQNFDGDHRCHIEDHLKYAATDAAIRDVIYKDEVDPECAGSMNDQNLAYKLQWCREHIPHFAEMEQRKTAAAQHAREIEEKLGYERLRS